MLKVFILKLMGRHHMQKVIKHRQVYKEVILYLLKGIVPMPKVKKLRQLGLIHMQKVISQKLQEDMLMQKTIIHMQLDGILMHKVIMLMQLLINHLPEDIIQELIMRMKLHSVNIMLQIVIQYSQLVVDHRVQDIIYLK